ncbi:hypothetical protein Psuf_013160 [Phytohabitans suffuscus]|uniref:Uncharacterized protein n=1 Tax=Phytohabitans suffuscus TaxID=624315 RepID=A0A6F8YD95_9ACTN|nr:hypothetical protein Psuf_013160 [Phytohabitans suffuscus]
MDALDVAAGDLDAVLAQRGDSDADQVEHLVAGEAGLALQQRLLVVVGEQVGRAVDELAEVAAVHAGHLLGDVRDERVATLAALLRVADHRVRVVGADQHEVEAADALGDRRQLDVAGLAHRAGVERGDLAQVVVGGADEAGGVRHLADVHRLAVDAVPLQPRAVVGEVGTHRAQEQRAQAELGHAERDVGGDATSPHDQVVDQERQGDLVQLIGDELVGEPTGETHEMVGGDRAGNGDLHGALANRVRGCAVRGQPTQSVGAPVSGSSPSGHETGPPAVGGPGPERSDQWNESPQAQEPCALGLSIVKPWASIRSAKSMVAPDR